MDAISGGLITDLGNVIIAYWLSHITPENFHEIDYDSIPEVPGAFESLRRFNTYYEGNVTVAYKATEVAGEKIQSWLKYHRFFERTGIPLTRIVHSSEGRDKTASLGQVSARNYGTTVVVDDRLEVLNHFIGKVPSLFLFRPQDEEVKLFNQTDTLSRVQVVHTWKEVTESLRIS